MTLHLIIFTAGCRGSCFCCHGLCWRLERIQQNNKFERKKEWEKDYRLVWPYSNTYLLIFTRQQHTVNLRVSCKFTPSKDACTGLLKVGSWVAYQVTYRLRGCLTDRKGPVATPLHNSYTTFLDSLFARDNTHLPLDLIERTEKVVCNEYHRIRLSSSNISGIV